MAKAAAVEMYRLMHESDAGTTVAVIAPAWGANILGFTFHPRALQWPISFLETVDVATIAEKPTSFGIPVLGPTPGRVGAAQAGAFRFDGRDYHMAQPRHGFFRNLPWAVAASTPSSITCVLDVRPSDQLSSFPFELGAEYHVTVADGRLDARLTLAGRGNDQPVSLGWHPYLQRDAGCRLHIPASSYWELDASPEPVPTGRVLPVQGPSDFREGRVLDRDEHWDLTLTGLSDNHGRSASWLDSEVIALGTDGARHAVGVRRSVEVITEQIPNIQLYTAPGRSAICIEPFSSPPNAVNLLANGHEATGVQRLRRGENATFSMSLHLLTKPLR